MEIVRLEEICELITDGTHQTPTYSKEGYIFLSSKNVTSRKIDWQNIKYISEELHRELIKRVIPKKNDILLAKNGTTGVGAIVDKEIEFDIYVSLALLRPNDKVLPRYLFWAVNSPAAKRKFDASLKGIGVKNLHLSAIKKIEINIYNKETQEKIIKVLDKLQKILEERQKLLENLDLLSKCLFNELKLKNKNWDIKSFAEVTKVSQGLQISISKRKKEDGENRFKYITIQFLNGSKEVEYIENPKENVICTEEDILMTRTGNTGMVVTGVSGVFHNNFFIVKYNKNILRKEYLVAHLNSREVQEEIKKRAGTSTIPDLNHGEFYKIKILIPPINFQEKFSEQIQVIYKSKFEIQKSIEETQKLFDSLMEKYFG